MPGYIIVAGVTGAGSLAEGALPEPADEQRQKAVEYVAELDRPPVDVQAAVTVLGRLPTRSGLTVDVGADLTGASLEQANLTKANLLRANLTGAIYLVQGQVDVEVPIPLVQEQAQARVAPDPGDHRNACPWRTNGIVFSIRIQSSRPDMLRAYISHHSPHSHRSDDGLPRVRRGRLR